MNKRKPGTFENGNKVKKGKASPGSGRTPEWLKAKCQKIIEKSKLIEFLAEVAEGKDIDQAINENGECLKIPAGIKERLKATEMLLDRGFGKTESGSDLNALLGNGQVAALILLPKVQDASNP